MFTAARDSVALETRKGRTATVRPFTNFHSSNVDKNSIANHSGQRLSVLGFAECHVSEQAAVMFPDGTIVLQDDFT